MTYRLMLRDRKSMICPKCSSLVIWNDDLSYKCADCKAQFKVVGFGIADTELMVEDVTNE